MLSKKEQQVEHVIGSAIVWAMKRPYCSAYIMIHIGITVVKLSVNLVGLTCNILVHSHAVC